MDATAKSRSLFDPTKTFQYRPFKKTISGFVIIAVYVNDLNIIGTQDESNKLFGRGIRDEGLGQTMFCLGLQIEHSHKGIFVHQSTYTKRVLKRFNMDKANLLSTPMVVRLILKLILSNHMKKMKRYLVLKYHI